MRGNDWERVRASKGIQLFLNVLSTWQEKKKNKTVNGRDIALATNAGLSLSPPPSLTHRHPHTRAHTAADNAVCFGFNEKSSDSHSARQAAV